LQALNRRKEANIFERRSISPEPDKDPTYIRTGRSSEMNIIYSSTERSMLNLPVKGNKLLLQEQLQVKQRNNISPTTYRTETEGLQSKRSKINGMRLRTLTSTGGISID
jgi:hypothetical protein